MWPRRMRLLWVRIARRLRTRIWAGAAEVDRADPEAGTEVPVVPRLADQADPAAVALVARRQAVLVVVHGRVVVLVVVDRDRVLEHRPSRKP